MMNMRTTPPQPRGRTPVPFAKPLWTYIFMAVNVAIFLLMTFSGGTQSSSNLIRFGANYAPLVASGEYWRLFTANFIHIGIAHLLFNMFALFQLGTQVEAVYGRPRFVLIYLLSGVSGAIFSYMFTQGLSAGASTSLFGLFGALVVYFYKHREMFGRLGQQQLISLGVILLINVFIGLSPGSNVDNWGHFGGFLGGVILAWFLCPRYQPVDPLAGAFETVVPQNRKPELSNGYLMDTNSLAKQTFPIALFIVGLVALTLVATAVQRPVLP